MKNGSGSKIQQNGRALGDGIYFAPNSNTSWGYSRGVPNRYKNSELGQTLSILGLCEVATVKDLTDFEWARTLLTEKACVVRFLFIGSNFDVNVVSNPPKLPSIMDILNYHAKKAAETLDNE